MNVDSDAFPDRFSAIREALRRKLVIVPLVFLVACAADRRPFASEPLPPVKKVLGEAIIDYLPSGWQAAERTPEELARSVQHFLPPGQGLENWREIITIVSPRVKGTPTEVAHGMIEGHYRSRCEDYGVEDVEQVTRNSYPMATKLVYCSKSRYSQTGKGGVAVLKAINAKRGPKIIVRQVRLDAFDIKEPPLSSDKKSELLNWAKQIYMCDSSDATRPCPPDRY